MKVHYSKFKKHLWRRSTSKQRKEAYYNRKIFHNVFIFLPTGPWNWEFYTSEELLDDLQSQINILKNANQRIESPTL